MKTIIRAAFIIIAIAVIIAAILLMFRDSQEETATGSESETKTVPEENFDRPQDTAPDRSDRPEPVHSLPPGHARIDLTISKVEDGVLTAEVHRVLGYGSSTRPIASDTSLIINAGTYLKNRSMDTAELSGNRFQAIVSMRQTPDLGEDKGKSEWVLEKLISQ